VELVIIDGIRDLISDINSPEDATKISDYLLRWTNDTDVHIINIIHTNKGDNNARGHVGTELVNKSETVASVNKDDVLDPELSIVEAEYTRNPPFDKFAFYINQDGIPERGEVPEPEPTKEKIYPGKYKEFDHRKVLNSIFRQRDHYSWSQLCEAVKAQWELNGVSFGQQKARSFVAYYEQKEWIRNVSETQKANYELC
jgi:hypothetical protein